MLKQGPDTKAKITGNEWQTVTKATTYHFIACGRGGLEDFWGSHGFQVNGEGLCQSRTDHKDAL